MSDKTENHRIRNTRLSLNGITENWNNCVCTILFAALQHFVCRMALGAFISSTTFVQHQLWVQ
jgi:hypothetical protein